MIADAHADPHSSAKLNRFLRTPKIDPIAGIAHHLVAPCPASDSHPVSDTPFESQKLVESETLIVRSRTRLRPDLAKLRYFAGRSTPQAFEALVISSITADRHWAYAPAWLCTELERTENAQADWRFLAGICRELWGDFVADSALFFGDTGIIEAEVPWNERTILLGVHTRRTPEATCGLDLSSASICDTLRSQPVRGKANATSNP